MKFKDLTFLFLVLGPALGWSEPYFAAWKGVNCNACHVNQTGGWFRDGFGKNYGNKLATFDWEEMDKATQDAAKLIPTQVSVGLDIHEAYFSTFNAAPALNQNGFSSGRQALEVGVKANPDLTGVLTYRLDDMETREIYALWTSLPDGGFLKVGKFTVPYGLELADDNSLVRNALGFSFDNNPAEGLEGGIYPDPAFLNLAFFNGDQATSGKVLSGKGGVTGDGWALAGSLFAENLALTTDQVRYGVYGWGRIAPVVLLAEYDAGYNGLTSNTQDNIQAYHLSAEGDLGYDCYLRLATEWLWDSMGTNASEGYRHVVSFRCYPVHNLKFQLDLARTAPSTSNPNYALLGPVEDMVMADAFLFY